ncbi:esterase/lipase family protein [Massilia sp. DD77]|uniref:esterase/lipase family protein n=1 Tax=Massilia sp. DD77 TaxID=3109349 RepID=UPI002FFDB1A4
MLRLFQACAAALLAASACCAPACAANNYPVILVHGVLGFGPDEFQHSGFNYWGGYGDIARHMQVYHGPRNVFAAAVGPISSNWDRAAELYAQIKGGCVDYGAAHVRKYGTPGQAQKPPGKCWAADPADNPQAYPLAFYPAWDAAHPIHMIGHSQGGTTIRALVELLEHGSPEDEGDGELYRGGKLGWIRSVTTISSPHNGTTLSDAVFDIAPSLRTPLRELLSHRAAQWELAPDGARDFNRWARTSPLVYYYSVGTLATEAGSWCCNDTDRVIAPIQTTAFQYPRADMIPYFKLFAGEWIAPSPLQRGIGGYTQDAPGRQRIDSDWFANDGVVNTVSMRAPNGHPVRDFDGTSVKGSWNYLGTWRGYDHFDIVNWPNKGPSADALYEKISDIIFGL